MGKDLEQATRIGLQGRTRYRVVTQSGQMVDIAGKHLISPLPSPVSVRSLLFPLSSLSSPSPF